MARAANPPSPNQTDPVRFAELQRTVRRAGQSQIARETGISEETIRRWLNGVTISEGYEEKILLAAKRILLAKGGQNKHLRAVGEEVLAAFA